MKEATMNFAKLIKYATEKDIKLIKGWKDDYENIMCVFQISGKKFGLVRMGGDWFYFLGIGSSGKTKEMPAGRGDYFIAQKIDSEDAGLLSSIVEKEEGTLLKLNNKTGSSWAPKNEDQKIKLAKLIDDSAQINDYLSQMGILYAGGDKVIFGEDVTGEDILKWKVPAESGAKPSGVAGGQAKQTGTREKSMQSINYNLPSDQEEYWRDAFLKAAMSQMNVPYYWGGDDPGKGFDCSGLVHWSLNESGLVPGAPDDVAAGQMNLGASISEKDLKKGDLVGFRSGNSVPHIGIYTGEGTSYISASGGGRNTRGDNPKAKVQLGSYTRYGAPAFFSSIAPLIQKRISSKNIA